MRGERNGLELPDAYLPMAVGVVIVLMLFVVLFRYVKNAPVRRLPSPTEVELGTDSFCVLCKQTMGANQLHRGCVKKLPCSHCFHLECLGFWVMQKGNVNSHRCPQCRALIADHNSTKANDSPQTPSLRTVADKEE